jgi:hypothetical protein
MTIGRKEKEGKKENMQAAKRTGRENMQYAMVWERKQ